MPLPHSPTPPWLHWAQRLQAIAQTGLTYNNTPYDQERYQAIQQIAAEMLAAGSHTPIEPILGLFAGQSGYPTPKVDVRGVIFQGATVLLVQERSDGRWTLPGGWADIGDSPAECVVREISEESGYEARAVKLLAVYDRNRHGHPPHPDYIYKLFFQCEVIGGQGMPGIETAAAAFFPLHNLPPLSLSRVTAAQIQRMYDHYCHPTWPTDFD